MANNYNKDDLFIKMIGANTSKNDEEKQKNIPQQLRDEKPKNILTNSKIGRPPKTQEDVKKYSYYLTKRHVASIKKLAINLDTDFSSIVRDALEEYARKHKEW